VFGCSYQTDQREMRPVSIVLCRHEFGWLKEASR